MRRHPFRLRPLSAAVSVALVAGLVAVSTPPAGALQTTYSTRTAGADRYATSAAAALDAYSSADAVVLVSGEEANFPDGLSAAALAGTVGGPVVLTEPHRLTPTAAMAIGELLTAPATVYIVGGTAAVSEAVATDIRGLDLTVERIWGDDRYATAVAVAEKVAALRPLGSYDGQKAAILAAGRQFPDALAIGGLAHSQKIPVLLVDTALSTGTSAFLDSEAHGVREVIIVGGTAAVPASVATAVRALRNSSSALQVTRVSGANRYATAVEVAKLIEKSTTMDGFGHTIDNVVLVSGRTPWDALTASALVSRGSPADGDFPAVGNDNSVLLLHDGGWRLNSATKAYLATKVSHFESVRAVGTTASVSNDALADAKTAITKATPTVSASPGLGVTTVTFSFSKKIDCTSSTAGTDGTGGGLKANYLLNNSALSGHHITCASSKRSATLTLGSALAAGDRLTVLPITTTAVADADGVGTSTSQTARSTFEVEGATPTSGAMYIGSTSATVTFDMAIAMDGTEVSVRDANGNANAVSSVTANTNNRTWLVTMTDAITADDTMTVTITNKPTLTVNPTWDKTNAALQSAKITATTYTGASATLDSGSGDIKVASKATGGYPGEQAETWTVQLIEGTATTSVTVDTDDETILIMSPIAMTASRRTASSLVSVMNATSSFSAHFTASVVTTGTIDAVHPVTTLSGGQSVHTVKVTMSEPMLPSTWSTDGTPNTNTDADADEVDDASTTSTTSAHDWWAGTLTDTITVTSPTETLVKGTSLYKIATTATDLAGNARTLAYEIAIS